MLALGALVACSGGEELPADLVVDPLSIEFGEVPENEGATADITVRNDGGQVLEVLSATLIAGDPEVFHVTSSVGSSLEAGESASITVAFSPQDDESAEEGRLQIRTSDPDGPVIVTLSGTGAPSTADEDEDGYSPADGDCDDSRDTVHPGAPEICDGRDDDCDGTTPDDESNADNDGYRVCQGDCDDHDRNVHPGADEICDGKDTDCVGGAHDTDDLDHDGFSVCGPNGAPGGGDDDCDDAEPLSFPTNPEICNGVDSDCSGEIDDLDADGDGHSLCHPAGDCDDHDDTAYPVVVDRAAAAGGDGTDAAPFRTVADALAHLDSSCHEVWVAAGDYQVHLALAGVTATVRGDAAGVTRFQPSQGRLVTLTDDADVTFEDLVLADGSTASDGGAVSITTSDATFVGVTFDGNESTGGDGGAIALDGGSLTLRGCTFRGNTSSDDGGAIAALLGAFSDTGSHYTQNSGARGGAIRSDGASFHVDGSFFDDNEATQGVGGAIDVVGATDLTLERSTFWRNTAAGAGGAVYFDGVDDADGVVRNNLVQNNTAGTVGGGVAFGGSVAALVLSNNTFVVNTATGAGGHVHADASTMTGLQLVANLGMYANGTSGLFADSGPVITHDTVFLSAGPNFAGPGTTSLDASNREENPGFVSVTDNADPADDDLDLTSGSPSRDSGPSDPAWDDPDDSQNDRGATGGPGATP